MILISITNDPAQAREMALAGVDRIMIDLEINGKEARQGHLDTVISRHHISDIDLISEALNSCGKGELMVRINPYGQALVMKLIKLLIAVRIGLCFQCLPIPPRSPVVLT